MADGIALLREALTTREARGLRVWNALIAAHLGEACVSAGYLDEARDAAARALALARERSERGHEAYALHLAGEVATQGDAPGIETAERRYCEALALADDLDMRPLGGRCHLALAKLYARAGKGAQGHEHLARATTMFHEMNMNFWLAKAQAVAGNANRVD